MDLRSRRSTTDGMQMLPGTDDPVSALVGAPRRWGLGDAGPNEWRML
jgi:hypothetical protein